MCGITGVLSRSPWQLESIGRMTDTLEHRGPDDHGTWCDSSVAVAFGHRRLSILDLSAAGHQPMTSHSGRYVITYNGELYNYHEISSELRQVSPQMYRGHSDTEVILAAFEQWGVIESIKRFNGMFAIGAWDRTEQTLWLARDPFGEKPLYYGWFADTFLFGSELKALRVHPEFDASIDRNSVALYLRYNCVPAPKSIYTKVKKLPAASVLKVSLRQIGEEKPQQYWSLQDVAEQGLHNPLRGSLDDAVRELDSLLQDAVKIRTMSDVPLGVFLSGGIDSSVITAMMQAQHTGPVRTFSVGMQDVELDEGKFAKEIGAHLNTTHSALYATPEQALQLLPEMANIYDEPFSDSSQIPTLLVSRFARQSVTVALSGDGGDELFGGYNRHIWTRWLWARMTGLPKTARRLSSTAIRAVSPDTWDHVYKLALPLIPARRRFATPGYKLHKFASMMCQDSPEQMYEAAIAHWPKAHEMVIGADASSEPTSSALEFADIEQRMMLLDAKRYLHDDILVKVDRASMSVGLETRAPFLDKRIAAFAWRLPLEWKIRDGVGKWVLRQVLYRYVPKTLIERPKCGFGVPLDRWLRSELRDWAESLISESRLRQEGFLQPLDIRKKWLEHLSGRLNWAYELWDILMFQSWLEGCRAPIQSSTVQAV